MMHLEYLNLKFTGSKGCLDEGNSEEMFWNQARLIITQNGVTTVKNLAGGIERIEEHLNNQLAHYTEQGWQTLSVKKDEEKNQSHYLSNTIHCILKRSVKLEQSNHCM